MIAKQTTGRFPFTFLALLGLFTGAGTVAAMAPQPVAAAGLTTWQQFIKDKCGGMSADAADRCASGLEEGLKHECGPPKHTNAYKTCWRKYIRDNGGTAGAHSSPFETETPVETDGTPSACGEIKTAIIKCEESSGDGAKGNPIWYLLIMTINILSAGVGILAVGGIIYASILYTTAEDKQDQVNKSKDIITNVVIGLVAYALMWSGLNFLIPGGLFN